MSTIFIPEALNIFPGDDGPNNSKHLQITNVKLPKLTEKTMEHHAGGAIGAIQIGGLGIQALELGFTLTGVDPATAALFGIGGAGQAPYTVYGAIRDKQTGASLELKAVAWGRMVEIDHGSWKRGDATEQTHNIQEITRYSLYWDKKELYYYDFYTTTWRVNGVSQVSDIAAILRIPGA